MATLEAKKASLTTKVANLLNQNRELLKGRRKDTVKTDALKKELGEMQKSLDNARFILQEDKGA